MGDIEETERGESGLKIMCTGESYKMSYRVRAMESVRGRCIFAQTREVERERERERERIFNLVQRIDTQDRE